ncbi:MAG: ABC transporter ATP-binding protein [Planctomycetaceae bacterium]|nr:ABC transporter ATP-binding protein [Planctomycetaceae bacterium]
MSPSNIVLRTERLHKSFENQEVLQGINLEIPQGQIVGLLGANGSGKTTLIKCLLGLLKPSAGKSELLGEPSWDLSVKAKDRLGYVPQEPALLPWMPVQSHANYVGAFYEHWSRDRVSRWLKVWDVDPKKQVGKLSVGQRQKLATILALGHDPELLILDEPVASLDPAARRQFMQSLIELAEDERHTVLFSTHIMSDVERVASHVAIMHGGEIAYYGELDQLKDRIKRVRLTRDEDFPATTECPLAIHSRVEGRHLLLSVDRDRLSYDELAERYSAKLEVIDLNLEEIFLDLCGGHEAAFAIGGESTR